MNTDLRDLQAERDFLLDAIEELDREHVTGALDDGEYEELRDRHVVRAAAVLRQLQESDPTSVKPDDVVVPKSNAAASWMRDRQKRVWAAGVVALVAVACVGIFLVVDERDEGEGITGDIAASSTALLQKAQQETAEKDYTDAVKTYDRVLEIDPNNVQAMTYRGWILNLAGLPDEALVSIDRAITIQPSYADAHFFKGYILLNSRQDPNGAIVELNAFLSNNPPREMVPLVEQVLKDAQARAAAPVPATD
jgi:cytochrome c-type biogenesis protein CcmH/NrfG